MSKRRLSDDGEEESRESIDDGDDGLALTQVKCQLPPCSNTSSLTFQNEKEYELHYLNYHTNICSNCGKRFPNEHLLELHIIENHSLLTKIRLEKGENCLKCFVINCDKSFNNYKKRRLHLIDKHQYPKNFIFSIVDQGIKPGQSSLLKRT